MLSAFNSTNNESVMFRKTKFQQCIPFLVTAFLGVELIVIISLITFYDHSNKTENLFYISSVSFIIISTIYFAWHSIVKENAFELVAFCIMSTILNAIAIYLAFRHSISLALKIICIGGFFLVQILYYSISVYLHHHYHKYMMHDLNESVAVRKLVAVRTFEMFISMIKADFMLCVILFSSFLFYAASDWPSFKVPGIIIAVLLGLALLAHAAVGILAVVFM
jgi:glucose-6-phosphate-specific signal transduction histidine kinase